MTATTDRSMSPPGRATVALSTIAFIAYFTLLHVLIVRPVAPSLSVGLIVAPWIVALVAALSKDAPLLSLPRHASPAVRAVLALLAIAGGVAFAWRYGERLADRVDALLFFENLAFLIALCGLFAVTLRGDREALVTRLARNARGGWLPQRAVHYTRQVTLAWATFFATMAAISTLLFTTQSRVVWSTFVNLLVWPLIAAMFALEYAIRVRVLRDIPHVPMMDGVHAFRQRDAVGPVDAGEHR